MAIIRIQFVNSQDGSVPVLVNDQEPVAALIPGLAQRLGLPEDGGYELVSAATGEALPADCCLDELGIPEGAELYLREGEAHLLHILLDKLYEEAATCVLYKAWEQAKAKLDEIARHDPGYPDHRGLRAAIAEGETEQAEPTSSGEAAADAGACPARAPAAAMNQGLVAVGVALILALVAIWKATHQPAGDQFEQPGGSERQAAPDDPAWSDVDQPQTKGAFTVQLHRVGRSYSIAVTAPPQEPIEVVVRGDDNYHKEFRGTGSLTTGTIKTAKPGVTDIVQVRSLATGEVQEFSFHFQ
jgi:hypothetical protein